MKTDREKAIESMNTYLESLENSDNLRDKKKLSLISYWMKDYFNYLKKEVNFNPRSLKRYERGDIIKVNLGYNIGSEEGGLHYGIVLDKNNALNSSVITIIPLTSIKNDDSEAHENDIVLGNEIYIKLQSKFDKIVKKEKDAHMQIINETDQINRRVTTIQEARKMIASNNVEEARRLICTIIPEYEEDGKEKIIEILKENKCLLDATKNRLDESDRQIEVLKKIGKEISRMKKGSIALMEQITTISKLRIYDPKNSHSVFNGIKLSSKSLDKIDEGIKKLYISK